MDAINSELFTAVEALLPAQMMGIAMDVLYKDGYELRLDTRGYLNNSLRAGIMKYEHMALMVADRTNKEAENILRHVGFDNPIVAIMAASFLICKMVNEGLYLDKTNQAVLSALMIIADAEEDGNEEMVGFIKLAREKAGKMLDTLLASGFYQHIVVPDAANS